MKKWKNGKMEKNNKKLNIILVIIKIITKIEI